LQGTLDKDAGIVRMQGNIEGVSHLPLELGSDEEVVLIAAGKLITDDEHMTDEHMMNEPWWEGKKTYLSGAVALESDPASVVSIEPPLLAQKGA